MILKDLFDSCSAEDFAVACIDAIGIEEDDERVVAKENFLKTWKYAKDIVPVRTENKVIVAYSENDAIYTGVYDKNEIIRFFEEDNECLDSCSGRYPYDSWSEELSWAEVLGVDIDENSLQVFGATRILAEAFVLLTDFGYTETERLERRELSVQAFEAFVENPSSENFKKAITSLLGVHRYGKNVDGSICSTELNEMFEFIDNQLENASTPSIELVEVGFDCSVLATILNEGRAAEGEEINEESVLEAFEGDDKDDDFDEIEDDFEDISVAEVEALKRYYERETGS